MNKVIKYSSLHKGIISKGKLSKIGKYNIDTLILNKYYYDEEEVKNKDFIKNIILVENKTNDKYIKVWNTKGENIYFNNQDNLGGITFSYKNLAYNLTIGWKDDNPCNIKEVNIVLSDRCEKIELDENVRQIDIGGYVNNYNSKEYVGISVRIESNHYDKKYYYQFDGINSTYFRKYICDKNSLDNGKLDLREINNYSYIISDNLSVDTLVITKGQVETLGSWFNEKLFVKKIRIVDENNMKLIPFKEIDFDDVLLVRDGYLTNKDMSKIIFLDDKDNIKIYDKEEMLNNMYIEDVRFIINSDCDLVVIKYKDKKYKLLDLNKEYELDYLFGKFLELNIDRYDFTNEEINILKECIKKRDYFTPFEEKIIDNNLLKIIYNDYLEFYKYLNKLNEIGLTGFAINYLIDKKYENIINTKSNNKLSIEDITSDEIDKFNELGEKNTVLKLLKIKKK